MDDFSFSTRVDFAADGVDEDDLGVDEVIEAQPSGIEPPVALLAAGREG